MDYSDKNKLVIAALLDIATGVLALCIGLDGITFMSFPLDHEGMEPVPTVVTFIVLGLIAGFLRGQRGAGNPWSKGLLVGGYGLVLLVFFALLAAQVAEDWYWVMPGSHIYARYWHHELRNKLAITAVPLLFVLSAIAGAGICYLQSPAVSKVIHALVDIFTGAVFMTAFFAVDHDIPGLWPNDGVFVVVGLIVVVIAAGFLRGRSGFVHPLVKGFLVGGYALLIIGAFVVHAIQHWSEDLKDFWFILLPLSVVALSILGAWLCNRQPRSNSKMVDTLLDITAGAVFLMCFVMCFAVVIRQFYAPWLIGKVLFIFGLIVTGYVAGFSRGRSGVTNPIAKGFLVGGFAVFVFGLLALNAVRDKSGNWLISWPLLFVLSSVVGAWLSHRQKPSTVNPLVEA